MLKLLITISLLAFVSCTTDLRNYVCRSTKYAIEIRINNTTLDTAYNQTQEAFRTLFPNEDVRPICQEE